MSAIEERKELLQAAAAVEAELRKVLSRVHIIVNSLLSEADRLKLAAADELSSGAHIIVTKVKYNEATKSSTAGPPSLGSPAPLGPGKRACSACRKPGHRKGSPECEMTVAAYTKPRGKRGKS